MRTAKLLSALLLTAEMPTCGAHGESAILPPRNHAQGAGNEWGTIQSRERLMQRHENSVRAGFTLVELLVVIGIIGLLIGFLLPTLGKARAAAARTACQSNVRQVFIGILNYSNDNHDWYPTYAAAADSVAYVQYPDDWIWWESNRQIDDSPIARYLSVRGDKLKNLLRCPADIFDSRKIDPGAIPSSQGPYFYSYSLNISVGANFKPPPSKLRSKRSQWHCPAQKILLTEVLDAPPVHWAGPGWGYTDELTRRHGQAVSKSHGLMGTNVSTAFMDGHVSAIDEDYFWNDVSQIHQNR